MSLLVGGNGLMCFGLPFTLPYALLSPGLYFLATGSAYRYCWNS